MTAAEAVESRNSSPWTRWFESRSQHDIESHTRPAMLAATRWEEDVQKMHLSSIGLDEDKVVETPEALVRYANELVSKHKGRRSAKARDRFQQIVYCLDEFVGRYSSVVDALTSAIPFGTGNLVWGALSPVITVAAKKHRREILLSDGLDRISKSLPRLEGYRELYPTDRMIGLLAELHANVIDFLLEAVRYYEHINWKGTFKRYFISSVEGFEHTVTSVQASINQMDEDIKSEGQIGMSAEVREARLSAAKAIVDLDLTRSELRQTSANLTQLRHKVDDTEILSCRRDVRVLKEYLVPDDYDATQVQDSACQQISALHQTNMQRQKCRSILQRDDIRSWLSPSAENQVLKKRDRASRKAHGLIWLYSNRGSDDVSHVALEIINECKAVIEMASGDENKKPILLHSMHQTMRRQTIDGGKRTVGAIVSEAIFQLLDRHPQLMRSNSTLKALACGTQVSSTLSPIEKREALLTELIHWATSTSESHKTSPDSGGQKQSIHPTTKRPVFWVIDRMDECSFKGKKDIRPLDVFMKFLQGLVRESRGSLRVLLVSKYPPERIDSRWREIFSKDDIDSEDDGKGVADRKDWLELEYD